MGLTESEKVKETKMSNTTNAAQAVTKTVEPISRAVENTASSVNHVVTKTTDTALDMVNGVAHSNTVKSLDQALANMITSTVDGVKDGVSFVAGQLPDVIQQIVVYNRAILSAYMMLALVLVIVGIVASVKFTRRVSEFHTATEWKVKDSIFPFILINGVVAVGTFMASFVTAANNFTEFAKVWFAPKLWLIEYAAHLVKSVMH